MKYLRIDGNNNVYDVKNQTKETVLKVENYIGEYRIVEDNR